MKGFKKVNIFTVLLIAASFAFAFRLANVLTFSSQPASSIGMTTAAQAVDNPVKPAPNEETPPLTRDDIEKAIKSTAQTVDSDAPAGDGKDGAAKTDTAAGAHAPGDNTADKTDAKDDAAPQDTPTFSSSELEVLQSLSKRRGELETREKKVAESEALIKAAEGEVDRKIAELNKLKAEIEKLLGQQSQMEDARITSLVKIYENMKPADAANIFNTLDMDVMLAVVGRMNERKLSPVLAAMDPDKARQVTIKLAEQRKLPEAPKAGTPAAPSGGASLNLPATPPMQANSP